MTRSQGAAIGDDVVAFDSPDMEFQVSCDVDRIIAGLDYDSFELLPGTVNPWPGMRFMEDGYEPFADSSDDPREEPKDHVLEDTLAEAPPMYLLPSPPPYWSPFLVDNRLEGKKKKKNKKKRNKNRQRQLQLQLQLEQQDLSPPSTPDISDGSIDSPMHSPMKINPMPPKVELSPEKKKKKRNKQRRRGSGRTRRLSSHAYPAYEGFDMMSVQLNGMNLSGGMYPKPDPYLPRSPGGPSYLGGTMFPRGTPLWIPHPHPIYGQC